MAAFVSVQKVKVKEGKMKKLNQFLMYHISRMLEAILLKFGMWSSDGRGTILQLKLSCLV